MSLIGLVLALIAILGGNMIEGGHPSALLDLPAFLIVIGGTIGAALTQFPFSVVGSTLKRFKWLLAPLKLDMQQQAELLENLAGNARRSGMLALEGMIDEIKDPFLQKGVQMMVDGYEKTKIHEVLENEIEFEQEDLEQTVKFYEAMGGYCPTMGIVGAVFGLIHAMGLLDAPDKLGGAIAVAFIATIYGVSAANLIFLPFGNRYKGFAHQIRHYKEMTLTGILCIVDGESQQRLQVTLEPYLGGHGGKKEKAEAPENHERWLVSYADFMTLLFALFVVLYSFAMAKQSETRVLIQGFIESLGKIGLISPAAGSPVMQGGTGILEPESKTTPSSPKKETVLEKDAPMAASDPFNETIGASEKPSATESWPHKTKEQEWVQVTKKKLEQQLKAQIESKDLEVEQLGSQLVIRIGEKALFPADSAFLQPQFIPLVNKISGILADIPGKVVVTGHTDNSQAPVELYRSNWELSVLRSASIVHTLLTNPKLDATRVIAQGVADAQPRYPNDTPEHRQANRRVEITLSQGKAAEEALPILKP